MNVSKSFKSLPRRNRNPIALHFEDKTLIAEVDTLFTFVKYEMKKRMILECVKSNKFPSKPKFSACKGVMASILILIKMTIKSVVN